MRALLLLLAACGRDAGSGGDSGLGTSSPQVTGDDPPAATCVSTDNALRFDCTATLSSAWAGTWEVSENGAVVRTFATPSSTSHAVTLWGLAADTSYTWKLTTDGGSTSGAFTTGSLPSTLDDLVLTVTGSADDVDAVALPQVCGGTTFGLVVDTLGRVVWYQDLGSEPLTGYAWTDRDTFLYTTGGTSVTEIDPAGNVLWTETGFDRPLHHDLHRGGDYVYALNAQEYSGQVVDGFYVLQDGAVVGQWDLADYVDVPPSAGGSDPFWQQWFPDASDWTHGNSIWSDGTTVYVSLRWQDAVLKIDGDPMSSTFGEIEWTLTGTSDTDLSTDFAWTDGGSFDGQHHVTPIEGGLSVFDNRAQNLDSRALTLTVDESTMTVSEAHEWSLGQHCDIQGGAFLLDDGGMLATCATASYIALYPPTSDTAAWTLEPSCGSTSPGGPAISKAIPVDLP